MNAIRRRQQRLALDGLCTICGAEPLVTKHRGVKCREAHRQRGRAAWANRLRLAAPVKRNPLPHPDVQHVSRLFTTAAVKKTLHANGSWWCGCDRDTFYARLQENAERIQRNSLAYPMGSDGYAPEEAW